MKNILYLVFSLFLLSACSPVSEYESYYDEEQTQIKEKGTYRYGQKHGTWKDFAPNGDLSCQKEFLNGKETGVRKDYVGQQLILETEYMDDQIHGISRQYDSAGKLLYIHQYRKGKLHGTSIAYDYSFKDSILSKKHYDNGLLVEELRYDKMGELIYSKSHTGEE